MGGKNVPFVLEPAALKVYTQERSQKVQSNTAEF